MTSEAFRVSPEDAFHLMFARNYKHILAYCGRRLPSADALDAVADTFLIAWRRFDEVPGGEGERPWLYGVAYRVVSNHRRSTRRRHRLLRRVESLAVLPPELPDGLVLRQEAERQVLAALSKLGEIDREILLLRLWEELSIPRIAEILGISEVAVRKRNSRAVRRLEAMLEMEKSSDVIPLRDEQGGGS